MFGFVQAPYDADGCHAADIDESSDTDNDKEMMRRQRNIEDGGSDSDSYSPTSFSSNQYDGVAEDMLFDSKR
jgi:hypothetical protein